jgi:hypothetical protein
MLKGPTPLYEEIRIKNSLRDKNGDEVGLKKGADVEVTVEAHEQATVPKSKTEK